MVLGTLEVGQSSWGRAQRWGCIISLHSSLVWHSDRVGPPSPPSPPSWAWEALRALSLPVSTSAFSPPLPTCYSGLPAMLPGRHQLQSPSRDSGHWVESHLPAPSSGPGFCLPPPAMSLFPFIQIPTRPPGSVNFPGIHQNSP